MSDAGNGGGGAASSSATAVLKKPVLKPPRFGSSSSSTSSGTAFTMSAPKLQFQGFKESKLGDSVAKLGAAPATASTVAAAGSSAASSTATATDSPSTTTLGFIPLTKDKPTEPPAANSSSTKSDSSNAEAKPTDNGSGTVTAPKSSASASATAPSSTTSSSSSSFVFGQSAADRVENVQKTSNEESTTKPEEKSAEETLEVAGKKPTSSEEQQEVPADEKKPDVEKKTLSEAAAEYCESHQAQKRRYEEITPVTGEENERNVAQISAKLYVFDKATSNWTEKGRGCLRLNDVKGESGHSRVVMRSAATFRVILNTKLFPGMSVESPSEKNIRMTGMDGEGQARIFLIGGAAKDVGRLFALMKERTAEKPASSSSSPEDAASEDGEDEAKRPKVQGDDA